MSEIIKVCKIHGELTVKETRLEKNGKYTRIQCISCKKESDLLRKRKITKDEYFKLLEKQKGKCAICEREETHLGRSGQVVPLAVDHCHKCDTIRGLLCQSCNTAIGKCGDDIAIIQSAIEYLKKHAE